MLRPLPALQCTQAFGKAALSLDPSEERAWTVLLSSESFPTLYGMLSWCLGYMCCIVEVLATVPCNLLQRGRGMAQIARQCPAV